MLLGVLVKIIVPVPILSAAATRTLSATSHHQPSSTKSFIQVMKNEQSQRYTVNFLLTCLCCAYKAGLRLKGDEIIDMLKDLHAMCCLMLSY